MTDLLPVCEKAVRLAQRRGASDAEAFGLWERSTSADLEKGSLAAAESTETVGFGVRVVRDDRVGFAYATTEAKLGDAIATALKASRLSKRLPRFAFPGPAKATRPSGLHDPRVEALGGEELLGMGGQLLDAVTGVRKDLVVAGGSVHAGAAACALANSQGLAREHRDTGLGGHAYVVQRRDGVSTGFASAQSTRWDVKWEGLGKEAGELAVASAKPKPLAQGAVLPCLVKPESAADLLSTVTVPSLFGKPARRGESFYSNKLGKPVMHPRVNLVEDATQPRGLGSMPFDDEGVPTRPRRVVASGVLRSFLYDAYDGAEYGERPTGNALRSHAFDGRSYKSPPSTSALQMRLEAPGASTAKLIASIDEGLLLHDLMGVHTANATSGDFSVTSSVLFRIRRGSVEGPVAPLSVAGNVHKTLREGVRRGDDVKALGGSPAWAMPSILFDGFTVTP